MFSKQVMQIVLVAQSIVASLAVMSVNVPPNDEICFAFKTIGKEACRISGNYEVYDDDLEMDPINVVLFDYESEKVIWYSHKGASHGDFNIVNTGKYHLCFSNGHEGFTASSAHEEREKLMKLHAHPKPKEDINVYENLDGYERRIGFQIRVEPVEGTKLHEMQQSKMASPQEVVAEQTMRIEDLTYDLKDKMDLLLDHQEYIKGRELYHRHIVEQTFTMVMRWTILEATILIAVASAQVMYLKRFFETKRFL